MQEGRSQRAEGFQISEEVLNEREDVRARRSERTDLTHPHIVWFAAVPPALFLLNLRFHICQFLRAVICLGELGEENNCLTPLQLRDQGACWEVLSLICAYRHQGEPVMSSARACVVSDGRTDRVILWVWPTRGALLYVQLLHFHPMLGVMNSDLLAEGPKLQHAWIISIHKSDLWCCLES